VTSTNHSLPRSIGFFTSNRIKVEFFRSNLHGTLWTGYSEWVCSCNDNDGTPSFIDRDVFIAGHKKQDMDC